VAVPPNGRRSSDSELVKLFINPYGLVQGSDGNFYGNGERVASLSCGNFGCPDTMFKVTDMGTVTVLHSFSDVTGGYNPTGLVQATDTNFYGTTGAGGLNGSGTFYRLSAICNGAMLSVNAALYPAPVPGKIKFFVSLASGPQSLGMCDALATSPATPGSACTTSYTSPAVLGMSCGAQSTCNPANGPSMLVTGMSDGLDNGVFQITRFVTPGQIKVKAPNGGVTLNDQTGIATFSSTCSQ
jgi:hypothetical protein